jgi:hypothetical protein
MSEPTDKALYNKVKAEVDKTYTKPSAYRSMAYTRFYLKEYEEKYGTKKTAYKGKKKEELKDWRDEEWIDVKSFLRDPKNPTACGNEPYKKGEYPLCMPINEAGKYSRGELELLRKRKNEIGKQRLVKDAYLRDVLKPDEIPPERVYKQKYLKEKLPKPLPPKEAEKILKEKPILKEKTKKMAEAEEEQKVTIPTIEELKPRRPRGRPKLSEEQLKINKEASLQRRREARQKIKEENRQKREETRKTKEEEKARAKAEAEANRPVKQTRKEAVDDALQGIRVVRTADMTPEERERYRRELYG